MAAAKGELRRSMRRMRESMAPEDAVRASGAIATTLIGEPAMRAAIARGGFVALYAAMRGEVDTAPIAAALAAEGVPLAYPRVTLGQRSLTFHRVGSADELAPGTFDIPEPLASAPVVPARRIAVFLVPGLAFDRQGNRLGWGMGHYDTTLSNNLEALRVGLAYETQLVDQVPVGGHDLPMHMIVTERGVVRAP